MLRALLESLRKQGRHQIQEVIVVDDSPTPAPLGTEFRDLNLKHLCLKTRVFYSRAKNIGWRASEAEFVYFIDDDNVAIDSTIVGPYRRVASSPEIGAVMPSVLYKTRPDLVWVYATPLRKDRWSHDLIGRNLPRNTRLENQLLDTDALPNAAITRRRALEELGGFDERMVMSSSADAAVRLKRLGWRVHADSGAFILHDVPVPGTPGFWTAHGAVDPDRVFFDVRDWFLLMRSLHGRERFFLLRSTRRALGFMLPNALGYSVRGPRGRRAVIKLARGYLSGLRATWRRTDGSPLDGSV
jgi:GT2 family glycosyltransferase